MNETEYQDALRACYICAQILRQHDLPQILNMMSRADSIGVMIDPTLWMQNHDKMEEDKTVVNAAMPLFRIAKQIEAINAESVEANNDH